MQLSHHYGGVRGPGQLPDQHFKPPLANPYLGKVPIKPWGDNYDHHSPGIHGINLFEIYSCGPGGLSRSGGEDSDDINSWKSTPPYLGNCYGLSNPTVLALGYLIILGSAIFHTNPRRHRLESRGTPALGLDAGGRNYSFVIEPRDSKNVLALPRRFAKRMLILTSLSPRPGNLPGGKLTNHKDGSDTTAVISLQVEIMLVTHVARLDEQPVSDIRCQWLGAGAGHERFHAGKVLAVGKHFHGRGV